MTSVRILLFGATGQLGWELQRALAPLGEVVALHSHSQEFQADFVQPERLAQIVRALQPHVIVNAAAHTDVDGAEMRPELALCINATAPAVLAREAKALDAWLLHYSTDYVFDGSGTKPWSEDAPTAPVNRYGCSKLDGERLIRTSGVRHLIVRSSWLHSARRRNFAKTVLRLATSQTSLSVVDDQIGAPTGADLLADVSAHVLRVALRRPEVSGTYHATASGETSWHAYACHVIDFARRHRPDWNWSLTADAIAAVSSSQSGSIAARPLNSRLDTQRLRDTFGLVLPHWRTGVERTLVQLLAADGHRD